MTASIGWLVAQRDLTGSSVRVRDAPRLWVTLIFTIPSGHIVGMHIGATSRTSLKGAVSGALEAPAEGAPSERPAAVVTAAALLAPVRAALRSAGIAATVEEGATPDWAEDTIDELIGHLGGRMQADDPPTPADRAMLLQSAAAYARAAPWERRADDVHLRLEVTIGAKRSDMTAIVTGNAGISRGLVLCPGPDVPASFVGDGDGSPPAGTCHLAFAAPGTAPADVAGQAERYAWPADLETPLFLAIGTDGPQEIDADQARALTVALAAVVEHDRQGAGMGEPLTGELILTDGRRAGYRATMATNQAAEEPGDVRIYAGQVRDDLLPEGTVIGLGGLPWAELDRVRSRAAVHLSVSRQLPRSGDGLPILILGLESHDGERLAATLRAARPEGVTMLEHGGEVLVVIITATGLHGVTTLPVDAGAIDLFRLRLAATSGWHGILVSTSAGRRDDPIHGFFECVLATAPTPASGLSRGALPRRRKSKPKSRQAR
ncbi:MAG: hypothetical protein JF887_01760 [Candidatus Dormibacteraeota bacterium]|uniref:Uncharacterized protein n=1 Tax=Candidatus Amunia macphersoniae TaxID=3127014 RepID=A0A934KB02_9BACT|nr:hypothetical protein [Candidatus Dormibacteraeota bacterium]